jgi:hypothetical protein
MATLEQLCHDGILESYDGELGINQLPARKLYFTSDFCQWLDDDLCDIELRRDGRADPTEQLFFAFNAFVSGGKMTSQFARLDPQREGCWEIKLPDLRVFGWFVKKDVFIACYCDLKTNLIGDSPLRPRDYERRVREYKRSLNLNEPKYITGDRRYVISV